jgi:hypothetical protein
MAWPTSGDKASTTHLDAGTDDPGLARPQIKQNVDNVNNIIDEFGDVSITTPADGEVLTYVSANSRWENAAASGGGGGGGLGSVVLLGFDGTSSVDSSPWRFYHFTEDKDDDGIATVTSGKVSLSTGTYLVEGSTMTDDATNEESNPRLWNDTTNTAVAFPQKHPAEFNYTGNEDMYQWGMYKFTVSSATDEFILRYDSTTATAPINNITDCVLKLTKIS